MPAAQDMDMITTPTLACATSTEHTSTIQHQFHKKYTAEPVTNDHPLGPEKAVFSGSWSLVIGLHCTTIHECETVRAWRSGL